MEPSGCRSSGGPSAPPWVCLGGPFWVPAPAPFRRQERIAAGLEGTLKAQGLYSQSHLSPGGKLGGSLSCLPRTGWWGEGLRVWNRMVGHPDIESTSKVTTGRRPQGPGGPASLPHPSSSSQGRCQQEAVPVILSPAGQVTAPGHPLAPSWMTFMSSKKFRNCLCI